MFQIPLLHNLEKTHNIINTRYSKSSLIFFDPDWRFESIFLSHPTVGTIMALSNTGESFSTCQPRPMGHSPFVNGTGDTGDFESARQPFRICGGNVGATPCCAEVAQLQSKPSCSRLSGVMRGRFGLNPIPRKKRRHGTLRGETEGHPQNRRVVAWCVCPSLSMKVLHMIC
jgi:hypothetical protein